MNLEEELEYFHNSAQIRDNVSEKEANNNQEEDTLLGLDQDINLRSRIKIAKIDDERILNKSNGLQYIIKNHRKVSRVFKKRSDALEQKILLGNIKSKDEIKKLKQDISVENLTSVVQFYQLWCHGLFPKARFRDCIYLVRAFGSKSSHLKLYRRELIEKEIYKLKVARGIIDESTEVGVEEHEEESNRKQPDGQLGNEKTDMTATEDDDWSFMDRGSGLFVGDEEGPSHFDTEENENAAPEAEPKQMQTIERIEAAETYNKPPEFKKAEQASKNDNISDDSFSDDDSDLLSQLRASELKSKLGTNVSEEGSSVNLENFQEEEHNEELEVMKEMGL